MTGVTPQCLGVWPACLRSSKEKLHQSSGKSIVGLICFVAKLYFSHQSSHSGSFILVVPSTNTGSWWCLSDNDCALMMKYRGPGVSRVPRRSHPLPSSSDAIGRRVNYGRSRMDGGMEGFFTPPCGTAETRSSFAERRRHRWNDVTMEITNGGDSLVFRFCEILWWKIKRKWMVYVLKVSCHVAAAVLLKTCCRQTRCFLSRCVVLSALSTYQVEFSCLRAEKVDETCINFAAANCCTSQTMLCVRNAIFPWMLRRELLAKCCLNIHWMSPTCFDLITRRLNWFNPAIIFFYSFLLYTCRSIAVGVFVRCIQNWTKPINEIYIFGFFFFF